MPNQLFQSYGSSLKSDVKNFLLCFFSIDVYCIYFIPFDGWTWENISQFNRLYERLQSDKNFNGMDGTRDCRSSRNGILVRSLVVVQKNREALHRPTYQVGQLKWSRFICLISASKPLRSPHAHAVLMQPQY